MKIKKKLAKERAKFKRSIFFSITIMIVMLYLVKVLDDQGYFIGLERTLIYANLYIIEFLFIVYMFRMYIDSTFDIIFKQDRVKVQKLFSRVVNIPLDNILFVDVVEKYDDFQVILLVDKMKRSKALTIFDKQYALNHNDYLKCYKEASHLYEREKFYCYIIKNGGSKKYFYLYKLYKTCYRAHFTDRAIKYIKLVIDEYNLS
ncbi:MAG: hypothetical protein N2Z71_01630 [Caloramator sp.]|nr:hypothetical protein [Caloramator sp.]